MTTAQQSHTIPITPPGDDKAHALANAMLTSDTIPSELYPLTEIDMLEALGRVHYYLTAMRLQGLYQIQEVGI